MAKTKKDTLDLLADGDPKKIIALLLWKMRHQMPELSTQITEKDVSEFERSCDYLGVTPDVAIVRPQGRPAQEAIPAAAAKPGSPARRGVPARPAEPARPYVFVGVVAKGTMDSVKPIESDEDAARRRDEADYLRRTKDKAPGLAGQILADAQRGVFSNATLAEAAQALQTLARA